jgi:hypothetical protein
MAATDKSAFDRIQSVLTIITPVLVVAIGAYLNQNITRVESEIKIVVAMKPYFDMMAGSDSAKAKWQRMLYTCSTRKIPEWP